MNAANNISTPLFCGGKSQMDIKKPKLSAWLIISKGKIEKIHFFYGFGEFKQF